jgi:hypothetical protein
MADPNYTVPCSNEDGLARLTANQTNVLATVLPVPHTIVLRDASGNIPGSTEALNVATWADLLALDATAFPTGTKVFVRSFRDFAMLDKSSAAAVVLLVVGAAVGGGQWLRTLEPDPFWIYQTDFYVNPGAGPASDENTGLTLLAPLNSLEEWKRRVSQNWGDAGNAMTVHLLGSDPGITFDTTWLGGNTANFVTIDGTLGGTKVINNGQVKVVTDAAPGPGAGGVDGTLTTAATSWATSVGLIGIVNAGARAGARFAVFTSSGVGGITARVGNVGAAAYDATPVSLQVDDTFDTWSYPTLTQLTITGGDEPSSFGLQNLKVGVGADGFVCTDGVELFCDACVFEGVTLGGGALPQIYNSYAASTVIVDNGAIAQLRGGGCRSGVQSRGGGKVQYGNWTNQGAPMAFGDGSSLQEILRGAWVASFDVGAQCLDVPAGCSFRAQAGARQWGQGCTGPRIVIAPGAEYVYQDTLKPNITGPGAADVQIVASSLTFAQIPAEHIDTGKIVDANAASDIALEYGAKKLTGTVNGAGFYARSLLAGIFDYDQTVTPFERLIEFNALAILQSIDGSVSVTINQGDGSVTFAGSFVEAAGQYSSATHAVASGANVALDCNTGNHHSIASTAVDMDVTLTNTRSGADYSVLFTPNGHLVTFSAAKFATGAESLPAVTAAALAALVLTNPAFVRVEFSCDVAGTYRIKSAIGYAA